MYLPFLKNIKENNYSKCHTNSKPHLARQEEKLPKFGYSIISNEGGLAPQMVMPTIKIEKFKQWRTARINRDQYNRKK